MWHGILIAGHAVAGLIALVSGLVTIRNGRLFDTYLTALAAMTVFLVFAIGVEWGALDTTARVLFTAFAGLAAVMLWRAGRARRDRPAAASRPSASYVDHVGFTLVALFDAFVVIAVLDLGAPIWAVVGAGVLIAVAGHFALRRAERVLTGPERQWSTR